MKIITRILGKKRELSGSFTAGQIASGLFFLTSPKDMSETGIYTGHTYNQWINEPYLKTIRAHPQMIFFKEDSEAEQEQLLSETTYPGKLEEYDPSLHKTKQHSGTVNLLANFDLIEETLSLAFVTQQAARSRIYEGKAVSCLFPPDWKAIAQKMDSTLDDISRLIQKIDDQKKKALSPANTNQSLQELSK